MWLMPMLCRFASRVASAAALLGSLSGRARQHPSVVPLVHISAVLRHLLSCAACLPSLALAESHQAVCAAHVTIVMIYMFVRRGGESEWCVDIREGMCPMVALPALPLLQTAGQPSFRGFEVAMCKCVLSETSQFKPLTQLCPVQPLCNSPCALKFAMALK